MLNKHTLLYLMVHVVLLLSIGVTPVLSQQNPAVASTHISVSGLVTPSLTNQQIQFDIIYVVQFEQNSAEDLFIAVDPISTPASPDEGAGYIIAKGEPGAFFTLNFSREVQLISEEGGETLTATYLMSHNRLNEQSSSQYVLEQLSVYQLNAQGEYYFWVGGTISLANATVGGAYVGDFNIEVEYI